MKVKQTDIISVYGYKQKFCESVSGARKCKYLEQETGCCRKYNLVLNYVSLKDGDVCLRDKCCFRDEVVL